MVYYAYESIGKKRFTLSNTVCMRFSGRRGDIHIVLGFWGRRCVCFSAEFRCGFFMGVVYGICACAVCQRDFSEEIHDRVGVGQSGLRKLV